MTHFQFRFTSNYFFTTKLVTNDVINYELKILLTEHCHFLMQCQTLELQYVSAFVYKIQYTKNGDQNKDIASIIVFFRGLTIKTSQ